MSEEFVYKFNVHDDFPNQRVDSDSLAEEVNAADIAPNLLRIDTLGGDHPDAPDAECRIVFDAELSPDELTALREVVGAHQGIPEPDCSCCFSGHGSPEGKVVGNIGNVYRNLDGGSDFTLWVKESGNYTADGWKAK